MKGWNKISVLSLPDADGLLVGLGQNGADIGVLGINNIVNLFAVYVKTYTILIPRCRNNDMMPCSVCERCHVRHVPF